MNDEKPDYSKSMKAFLLLQVKIFLGLVVLLVVIMGALGYAGRGWAGVPNGIVWGLLFSLISLPIFGFLISMRYWGDFAGRWGEAKFKEQMGEGPGQHKPPEDY